MMKKSGIFIQILAIISLLNGANAASPSEEELEVILQFFEFELEDICVQKSEARWDFLNGGKSDLKQLLELELKEAYLFKNETKSLHEFFGKMLSNDRLRRLLDIFFYPGAPLLGSTELKEYKEYSVKLQEIRNKLSIGCRNGEEYESESKPETGKETCVPKSARAVNKILAEEKDEKKLREIWSEWFEELELRNRKSKYDFMLQLSILDMEAEHNEEDDLSQYWLKQTDMTDLDYHKVSLMWKEIIPLYQKIRTFMAGIMEESYGNVFIDKKLFPIHLLGTLHPEQWVTAAEKLGAFKNVKAYKTLKSKLKYRNMEDLYRMADNFTAEFKIGNLPSEFYNNSRFDSAGPFCETKMMDYCNRKNTFRAISCADDDVSITRFLQIHEDVAKLKHLMVAGNEQHEEENGFIFREGPRDSVIYEAIASLSSLIATRPKNLRNQRLLPITGVPNEEIFSLFVNALHIIPSLPYYLAADLWRINALKEMDAIVGESTYESTSTTPWYSSTSTPTPEEDAEREMKKRDASEESEESEADHGGTTESYKSTTSFSETTPTSNYSDITQAPGVSPRIYDFENLTVDWWKYREQLQGVGNSGGKLYADFLQDEKIIWNKPYLSKFLGKILQFQLLEYFRSENYTTNTLKIYSLLSMGKSKPAKEIVKELFDIQEISPKPLLKYFRPLEEFLDGGGKFQKEATTSETDDFNLFSDSYSMNSTSEGNGEQIQKGSNTTVFAVLILGALGIVVVSVFISLKRYRAKQRAKQRRKRQIEAINSC